MVPIGIIIESVMNDLNEKTGIKWSAQLTSRGFIVYRKTRDDDYVVHEYNKWREVCCAVFNIGYEDLDNDIRDGKNATPRHWCWYMMMSVSMINIDSIVKMMNSGKNRTSILHAVRKIHNYVFRKRPERKSIETYAKLIEFYQNLKQ